MRIFITIASNAIHNRLLQYSLKSRNQQLVNLQSQLVEAAHKAGMSDIAGSSLHYFGNLLTSLNVELVSGKVGDLHPLEQLNSLLTKLSSRESMEHLLASRDCLDKLNCLGEKSQEFIANYSQTQHQSHQRMTSVVETMKKLLAYQTNYIGYSCSEVVQLDEIVNLVTEIKKTTFVESGVELINEIESGHQVFIQRAKFLHVLSSLINNGIESMASTEGTKKIILSSRTTEQIIFLRIQDTGIGIAESIRTDIFRNGYSTKHEQGGFGLHVSANYMREMSGSLALSTSAVNHGSTFEIGIKLADESELGLQPAV